MVYSVFTNQIMNIHTRFLADAMSSVLRLNQIGGSPMQFGEHDSRCSCESNSDSGCGYTEHSSSNAAILLKVSNVSLSQFTTSVSIYPNALYLDPAEVLLDLV